MTKFYLQVPDDDDVDEDEDEDPYKGDNEESGFEDNGSATADDEDNDVKNDEDNDVKNDDDSGVKNDDDDEDNSVIKGEVGDGNVAGNEDVNGIENGNASNVDEEEPTDGDPDDRRPESKNRTYGH